MSTILIGWELGANRGHLVRMGELARRLAATGHRVVLASQRLSREVELPANVVMWQAPLWPRLLSTVGGAGGPAPNTMGDILARLGLDQPETLPALIAAWQELLQAVRPDLVVADFAPALLCAARGRFPSLSVGLGFDCVPAHLDQFPSLTGQPPVFDEAQLLDQVRRGLAASGAEPIERLPQLFAADRVLAGSFAELDCYAKWRRAPVVAPSVAHPVGEAAGGEEIFVYADPVLLRSGVFWEGLVRAALPVRVYAQGASPAQHSELEKLGFRVERAPIPFARIATRSRLTMSYGGLGFVSSTLAAGVPTVVVHYDLEKGLTGQAVTRLQLGGHVHLSQIKPDAFATSLRQLYASDSFQRRAQELAPGFLARLTPGQEEVAAAAGTELLG
jgi:rhamnosyltransferase subunit B